MSSRTLHLEHYITNITFRFNILQIRPNGLNFPELSGIKRKWRCIRYFATKLQLITSRPIKPKCMFYHLSILTIQYSTFVESHQRVKLTIYWVRNKSKGVTRITEKDWNSAEESLFSVVIPLFEPLSLPESVFSVSVSVNTFSLTADTPSKNLLVKSNL